jgi:hypothetical protein
MNTLQRAASACRTTPGRQGAVVTLQDCADVIVVGDLHGHVANFRRLLQIANLAAQPNRHLVLQELIHGPFRYPVGGDTSHQLLDLFAALKCQYRNRVHALLGNHELAQWTGQFIMKGTDDVLALFDQGVEQAYAPHHKEISKAYDELFAVLPVACRTDNGVFMSHSLPPAGTPGPEAICLQRPGAGSAAAGGVWSLRQCPCAGLGAGHVGEKRPGVPVGSGR